MHTDDSCRRLCLLVLKDEKQCRFPLHHPFGAQTDSGMPKAAWFGKETMSLASRVFAVGIGVGIVYEYALVKAKFCMLLFS